MDIVAGLPLTYFKLESNSSPMNMTQVVIFRKKSNDTAVAPSLDAIKYAAMQEVIHNQLLRQRIVESPFLLANPIWLDDPHLDIHHHIQQKMLDCNVLSTQGVLEVAAELAADNLDRGSPLWKVYYITFNHGESFAFVCVTHRSLLCRLKQTLFDSLFPTYLAASLCLLPISLFLVFVVLAAYLILKQSTCYKNFGWLPFLGKH